MTQAKLQPRRRKTASITTSSIKSNRATRKEARIKLQLFPIGESTRKALEKEGYNPHLELTISRRKKISSVLRHLKSKWGSVNIAEEIVLFPFDILLDNLAGYRRWTSKDTNCTAADVYESIGNPAIFRLRYGWFTNLEPETMSTPLTSSQFEDCLQNINIKKGGIMDVEDAKIEKQPCETVTKDYTSISGSDSPIEVKDEIIRPDREAESLDKSNIAQSLIPSSSIWTDNLTNISIGGLLSEASLHAAPAPAGSASCLQQIPFSCDSFDAAIAAHIYRHSQQPQHVTSGSHSSFLDAEETCHAFPSQKFASSGKEVVPSFESAAPVSCIQEGNVQVGIIEDRTLQKAKADSPPRLQEMDSAPRKSGQTGVDWSNPFGLLDLSLSSSQQLVRGDNISLSGFLPNSLDAFQNCSLFARDTKVAPSSS